MPRNIMKGISIFFLVSLLACSTGSMEAGYDAPGFRLKDLEGNTVSLEELRGRVVVVDFWATWCGPCLMSIPELVELQEKYRDKGLTILGISVDQPENISEADLRAFKNKLNMNYRVLRADRQVMADYFAGGAAQVAIPTLFVVDQRGKIREKLVGFRPGKLEETLKKLLS